MSGGRRLAAAGRAAIWAATPAALAARAAGPSAPAIELDEADHAARALFETAERFLGSGRWEEACEALERLMDAHGRRLAPAPEPVGEARGFVRYLPVRQLCQARLLGLEGDAAAVLAARRRHTEGVARAWWEQAAATRDVRLLERLADELLASQYGDDALRLLGELHLQAGRFTQARRAWERIRPVFRTEAGRPAWLETPREGRRLTEPPPAVFLSRRDEQADAAELRARLTLVSILEGAAERAGRELAWLKAIHPRATGRLGGRSGRWADLLAALLEASRQWPPRPESADWSTFGGGPGRGAVAPRRLEISGPPLWRAPLPRRRADQELAGLGRLRVAERREGLLSYYPIVVGRRVFVLRGPRLDDLIALDVRTGRALWPEARRELPGPGAAGPPVEGRYLGVPRFTLTAAGDMLLARLGSPVTAGWRNEPGGTLPEGWIGVLDLAGQRRLLLDPITPDRLGPGSGWALEGSPVSDGRRLYVAARRRDVQDEAHVACFDGLTGQLVWRQFICRAPAESDRLTPRLSHRLLTLAEGVLYDNTNLGVVAALRAEDGRILWATAYPRSRPQAGPEAAGGDWRRRFRDLNPCLVYRDWVIVAPADCDRVFALDAVSGGLVWASSPEACPDAVHLLGVGRGNVVLSGDALYWLDAATGALRGRFPPAARLAAEQAPPAPRGCGRGLLAGDCVYWPTREEILVFGQQTERTASGWRPRGVARINLAGRGVQGGNLAAAAGVLLVAGEDQLAALRAGPLGPAGAGGGGEGQH